MQKATIKKRLLFFSCLVGGMVLSGCTDGDFKVSSVDAKFGVDGNNLSLPGNNSVVVTLDDILDLGSTDLITVDANGDYKFGKDPESVNPVKVKVNKITFSDKTESTLSFDISLPSFPSVIIGQEVDLPYTEVSPAIDIDEQEGKVSFLKYEFDAPSEIKSLTSVRVGDEGKGVDLNLALTFPEEIKKFKYLKIEMPRMLTMTCNKSGFDPSTNILTLNDCTPNDCKNIVFNVTQINMQKIDDENFAKLEDGKFKLESKVNLKMKASRIKVSSKSSIKISGNASFNNLVITAANGQFKPTIDEQQVGSTTINSLPEFLTDARVVADIDNPQIWLTITSNMPLGGYVEAKLTSTTSSSAVVLSKAKGNELNIAANGTTNLVICRKAPANMPSDYKAVIASDLSNIIRKLEEGMKINIDITKFEAVQSSDVKVELGVNYELTPSYNFTAPLVLGDEAMIVYSKNEGDWNKDLKDLQLTKNSKVVLTAVVENLAPADLEINITPVGVDGNKLSTLTVNPVKNTVAAGATAGPIQYEITDPKGVGLSQLNGIDYELLVTAPQNAEKGKTLNKNQKITIKNVTLKVNGTVVIDAN